MEEKDERELKVCQECPWICLGQRDSLSKSLTTTEVAHNFSQ
jgi:hypothetical protein